MTVGMVPGASIAGMVFSLVVSFALPIGLFVYAKKKLGAKAAPFFIGCGVFFVMVLMLEAAIHRIVFQLAGEALTGSVILYAVYGNASVRRDIDQQHRKCRDDKFRHHVCTAGDS